MSASSGSQPGPPGSTIDEPIRDTIMRDVISIQKKFKCVLFPTSDRVDGTSRDWDLWGPFILCLVLSVVLAGQAAESQKGYVFALVYIIMWAGSSVVTLNALLLKGNISFFQTVCVLGYCILPLVLAAVSCWMLNQLTDGIVNLVAKSVTIGAGLVWAGRASVGFMSELVPGDRKTLAVYPVWLLYVAISWIIFLS